MQPVGLGNTLGFWPMWPKPKISPQTASRYLLNLQLTPPSLSLNTATLANSWPMLWPRQASCSRLVRCPSLPSTPWPSPFWSRRMQRQRRTSPHSTQTAAPPVASSDRRRGWRPPWRGPARPGRPGSTGCRTTGWWGPWERSPSSFGRLWKAVWWLGTACVAPCKNSRAV